MTTDGYALVQERNPQGVSTDQGMFTCGVAENIHRWLDEAPANELVRRINPLITLAETQNKVDFNYTPRSAHVPSPLLAAQRGIWEEVSEELWRLTKDHKDLFKFLNIVFDLNAFVPALIGVIELPFSRQEVEKIRVISPGKDHSEYKKIHYVPLNQGEEETRNLLLSLEKQNKGLEPMRWVPAGIASLITALYYWQDRMSLSVHPIAQ
jgi:hypothetical protein